MSYIYNPDRFEQAGLRKGLEKLSIQSTDIDCYIDMGQRLGCFVEFKVKGSSMGRGQELCARALLTGSHIPTLFIVANHDTSPEEEIAPNSYVSQVLWKMPGKGIKRMDYDESDEMLLDDYLATLALYVCPRLLKANPNFYFTNDKALDEILHYFHSFKS